MSLVMQRFSFVLLLIIKVQGNEQQIDYPKFPRQAQFDFEMIINNDKHQRLVYECIYDYQRNFLWLINQENSQFYNYTNLKQSIYSNRIFQQCQNSPIDINNPLDGFSAIENPYNHSTHIRSLDDFLLFTSKAKYFGETILRGYIHVDQWITSLANDTDIIWSFAKSNYLMPWNTENFTVPIQRLIRRKDDGLVLQILNIFSYKTKIIKHDLTPPKGIFCSDTVHSNELISLQDIGMIFPTKFSVRIDISTTAEQFWQTIHLRYYFINQQKFIRYDFITSDQTSKPLSLIFIYSNDNSMQIYEINRRTGFCQMKTSNDWSSIKSYLHNPIDFLIQHSDILLFNPPKDFFQYNGQRSCRGSIQCDIYLGQTRQVPFDSEDDWSQMTIEWAWSKRLSSTAYDYPVYLYLNFNYEQNEPSSNIQYEFYDFRTDVYLNEFNIHFCARSNQYAYRHLAFQLEIQNQTNMNSAEILLANRRDLTELIHKQLINMMSIDYLRISNIEIDINEKFFCTFTLLDRMTSDPKQSESNLVDILKKLENRINQRDFRVITDEGLLIQASEYSLKNIEDYFIESTSNLNEIDIHSYKIQIIIVLSGILIGLIIGNVMLFMGFYMIKRKLNLTVNERCSFGNISFRSNKNQDQSTITLELMD